ncbi:MAG: helix-turn-helix transcriptional regulator [Raoultibacter sp.]
MQRCKLERLMHDMKQSEVARMTGMHPTSISAIENGRLRPYPGQIEKIAAALNWNGDPAALFEEVPADDLASA